MKILINIILFVFFISQNLYSAESKNNIIFKINNKVFTNIDIEKRIKYFQIINQLKYKELSENNQSEIINNYITSLIFNEFNNKYNFIKNNIDNDVENIYLKILNNNTLIEINFTDELNLKNNIKIDLVRKKIIENYLNRNSNELKKESDYLDILYNYNLRYLIFKTNSVNSNILNNVLNRNDFLNFENFLIKNKIKFIYKSEDINNIKTISKNINEILLKEDNKILKEENNKYTTLYSIEKNLESYEGIFVKLISFNSDKPLNKNKLNCNFIRNNNNTEYKEYEYIKLNNQIKSNLKAVDDFIIINNDGNYNYIFLCELKYNEQLFNSINFNKKVFSLVNKFENKFLTKYKKEFKFIKLDE